MQVTLVGTNDWGANDGGRRAHRRRLLLALLLAFALLALHDLASGRFIAYADDCLQDITRAEDCLRTPGTAEGIAAGVATIVTVMVNGSSIIRTVFPPQQGDGGGGDGDDEDEDDTEYTLDLRTTDLRTTLAADGEDSLWVYGQVRCNKPEVDTQALTFGLEFRAEGPNAGWLRLGLPQMTSGFKAVEVRAQPPSPIAQPDPGDPTVMVSTTIEGRYISGPVQLTLDTWQYDLEIFE